MDEFVKRSDVLDAYYDDFYSNNYFPFEDVLNSVPAVDAVEVVRCRDCFGRSCWEKDENGCDICWVSGMYVRGEDDFCSFGDRKDNELVERKI